VRGRERDILFGVTQVSPVSASINLAADSAACGARRLYQPATLVPRA
jgi:hypothetical protein